MGVGVKIEDGGGSTREAVVSQHKALCVTPIVPDVPAVGTDSRQRYFNDVLGSTGAGSGTTNMNVDGAATSQEFYIGSNANYDLHIMVIIIVIADSAVVHSSFGNVAALATGWDLCIEEAGETTALIDKAKTGGQVIAQAGFAHAYGDGATSFELTNWTGTEDAQSIVIPIHRIMGPEGIRIGRGTDDRLVSVVNDTLTGLTEFTVRVLGFRRYP